MLLAPTDVYGGSSYKVILKRMPENATEKCIFESSDPAVCAIDENGHFTAYKSGSVKLTAKTADGRLVKSVTVTVHNTVSDITFEYPKKISVGQTVEVKCTILPLGADNKGVYYVNEAGLNKEYQGVISIEPDGLICRVTGLKPGKGYITIGSNDFPDGIVKHVILEVVQS